MKKKLFAFVIPAVLAYSLAGCGSAGPAATEPPIPAPQVTESTQAPSEEDGQNPVMNLVGVYSTGDSREALVEAEGQENARITVTYAPSPWFHDETVMSGRYDPVTQMMVFTNAAMTEYTYNSDGSVNEERQMFADVSGRAAFYPEDNTLHLTMELPSGKEDAVFYWGPSSDMKTVTDPDHYALATAMDKAKVETVIGYAVRAAYLGEDWYALADMINYPIVINGDFLLDSQAFIDYMQDKTVSDSDRQAMNDENLLDMFTNGQGICMGSGQVWLYDPNYMTDQEPALQIFALNGIVPAGKDHDAAAEAGAPRQDGERFERVIATQGGMEETVGYEHLRNETAGFEMDYEYEQFERHSEQDRERFILVWDDPEAPENYFEVSYSPEDAEAAAAAIAGELSEDYDIYQAPRQLERAGRCIQIEASVIKGTRNMADYLQSVYVIPASDGCRIVRSHCVAVDSDGFFNSLRLMLDTLSVIER